jgi:hypothetical protein
MPTPIASVPLWMCRECNAQVLDPRYANPWARKHRPSCPLGHGPMTTKRPKPQ